MSMPSLGAEELLEETEPLPAMAKTFARRRKQKQMTERTQEMASKTKLSHSQRRPGTRTAAEYVERKKAAARATDASEVTSKSTRSRQRDDVTDPGKDLEKLELNQKSLDGAQDAGRPSEPEGGGAREEEVAAVAAASEV